MLGDAGWQVGNMFLNSLTLLPAREIYPTPLQLPAYMIASPYDVIQMRFALIHGRFLLEVNRVPIPREKR